jgi:predicted O-methyltransferase YrrM
MNGAGTITRALAMERRPVTSRTLDSIRAIRRRHHDFDAVRDRIRALGTDDRRVFGHSYAFEGGMSLQQDPDELTGLCLFLKERGPYEHYMEIGSGSGGTCRFLFESVGFRTALSLDDGNHPRAGEQADNFRVIPDLKQFIGDSHSQEAQAFLAKNVGAKLDLAFIDGDHSFERVWLEVELTLPFCRKGALVIFHDTTRCDGVRDAWIQSITRGKLRPLAEYIGEERPLGITVNSVL